MTCLNLWICGRQGSLDCKTLCFTQSCLSLVSSSDMVVQSPNPKLRKGPEKEKSCDFWAWASIWSSLVISMMVWIRYLGQSRKNDQEDGFRELCYIITRKGGILQSEGQWKPFVSQWESKISRFLFSSFNTFPCFLKWNCLQDFVSPFRQTRFADGVRIPSSIAKGQGIYMLLCI